MNWKQCTRLDWKRKQLQLRRWYGLNIVHCNVMSSLFTSISCMMLLRMNVRMDDRIKSYLLSLLPFLKDWHGLDIFHYVRVLLRFSLICVGILLFIKMIVSKLNPTKNEIPFQPPKYLIGFVKRIEGTDNTNESNQDVDWSDVWVFV